jgi:hypothetical protein
MFQSTHLWNIGRHSIKNVVLHPRRFWAPNIDFLLQDRDSFQVTNKHSPSKVFYAMKAMTSKNWHFYTSWNLPELLCNYSANWQYLRSTVKRKLTLWKYVKVSSWYKVTSSFSCISCNAHYKYKIKCTSSSFIKYALTSMNSKHDGTGWSRHKTSLSWQKPGEEPHTNSFQSTPHFPWILCQKPVPHLLAIEHLLKGRVLWFGPPHVKHIYVDIYVLLW